MCAVRMNRVRRAGYAANRVTHDVVQVRRNAVLAIFTIYKSFDHLIPDAPELIQNFLEQEQDASCKRNV